MLVCTAISYTLGVPGIYDAIDAAAGHDGTARLIRRLLGVGGMMCLETMLLYWRLPEPAARRHSSYRYVVAAGMAFIMFGLYLRDAMNGNSGTVRDVLFAVALGFTMVDLAYRSCRVVSQLDQWPFARMGLHMFVVAGCLGALYPVMLLTNAWLHALRVDTPQLPAIGQSLLRWSVCTIAFGAVIPTVGPAVDNAYRRIRRAHRAQRIQPLWQAVVDGLPGLPLESRPSRRGAANVLKTLYVRDDWRAYRQVIEVRDAYLELRPWMDPDVTALALQYGREAGLDDVALQATAEAATVLAALRAKDRAGPASAGQVEVGAGDADMSGEIKWLAEVATALRNPVVVRVMQELARREQAKRSWVDITLESLGFRRSASPDAPAARTLPARTLPPGPVSAHHGAASSPSTPRR